MYTTVYMYTIIVYKLSLVHDQYCELEISLGCWIGTHICSTRANTCQTTHDVFHDYFMKKLQPSIVEMKCPTSTVKTIVHHTMKCPASTVQSVIQ